MWGNCCPCALGRSGKSIIENSTGFLKDQKVEVSCDPEIKLWTASQDN